MAEHSAWIWVLGDIAGLRWVIEHDTMAFAGRSQSRASTIRPGNRAVLYVTRGAFGNPASDQARLAGLVEVTSKPHFGGPVIIAEREFDLFLGFNPIALLPERQGPAVRDLVDRLELVRRPGVWGQYFRSSPIKLSEADFGVLVEAVKGWRSAG